MATESLDSFDAFMLAEDFADAEVRRTGKPRGVKRAPASPLEIKPRDPREASALAIAPAEIVSAFLAAELDHACADAINSTREWREARAATGARLEAARTALFQSTMPQAAE